MHLFMHKLHKLAWLLLLLVLVSGCRGCSKNNQTQQAPEKKKSRLVSDELRTLPYSKEIVGNSVKPGHWYQTRQKLKANQNDESLTATLYQIDGNSNPTTVRNLGIPLQFNRDISLAKGQEKTIELKLLQTDWPFESMEPTNTTGKSNKLSIFMRYSQRGLGAPVIDEEFLLRPLKDYQYDMLVLSRNTPQHIFWRGLDCIVWPQAINDESSRIAPHRVIDIAEEDLGQSIPNQLMTMTSISHMVINDVSLNTLPEDHQKAILDWLYFGGTIIINGPDAIAGIELSILKTYAPIQQTSSTTLTQGQIDKLNDTNSWRIRYAKTPSKDAIAFKPSESISILQGQLAEDSSWITDLEGLVAERLVGQGRIVMTSFPMNHTALVNWPSYSALIQNAILRKPARRVNLEPEFQLVYDESSSGRETDPKLTTRLRLWARDLVGSSSSAPKESMANPSSKVSSYGAWNSESFVTNTSSNYLKKLSGINVPNLSTIFKWLSGYLIVLVPMNWLVFRLLGRLELAWLAAPLIAIAGVFVIARAVQLDVGFSRSQTSLQFIELHNRYPRGLLSSHHALYSSLTTNYKIVYPEGEGIVCPMPQPRQRSLLSAGGLLPYKIADEKGTGFQSFPVLSNTIGLVQSEEVVSLTGAISWTIDQDARSFQVTNDSQSIIRDVILEGSDDSGAKLRAVVGTLEPGEQKKGTLDQPVDSDLNWDIQLPTEGKSGQDFDKLALEQNLKLIFKNYPIQHGEWIAMGWTESPLSKLQIAPSTAQTRSATLVLMHAKTAPLGPIEHDRQLMPKINKDDDEQ
jgi:hypothetical protein